MLSILKELVEGFELSLLHHLEVQDVLKLVKNVNFSALDELKSLSLAAGGQVSEIKDSLDVFVLKSAHLRLELV